MAQVLTTDNSLNDWEESLDKESTILSNLIYIELAAGAILAAGGGVYYYLTEQVGWLIFGLFMLFLAVSHWMKTKENKQDMGRIRGGRRGEEFVTKLLREGLPDNCYILNDLDVHDGSKSAQNDHVILSPAGIFVIETKAYGGTLSGKADDKTWTQLKDYKGNKSKNRVTNPITQNKYHIEVLNHFIENEDLPFKPEDVHSYVAMVNKYMQMEIEGDTSMVDYAWYLSKKIKKKLNNKKYSPEDIAAFLKAIDIEPPASLFKTPEKKEQPKKTDKKQTSVDKSEDKKKDNDYGDLTLGK